MSIDYNSLPTKSRPGKDMMSKAIVQNSTAINYITAAFGRHSLILAPKMTKAKIEIVTIALLNHYIS
jgi:hypothetical protein